MRVAILFDAAATRPDAPPDVSGVLEAVEAVDGALRLHANEPVPIAVESVDDPAWREAIRGCDVVFNLCENVGGVSAAEVAVARALEQLGVPVTGSGSAALELCRHKDRANARLHELGVPVPEWTGVDADGARGWRAYPAIVKPAAEDASVGITQRSFASDAASLADAIAGAAPYAPLLVQRFIDGRELNVGIVGRSVLPIAEIDFSDMPDDAWRAVTYAAKWEYGSAEDIGTHPRCPADIGESLAVRAMQTAIDAVEALGVTGYARVDLRVDDEERVWVVDVNPNPDLAPSAGLARMGRAAGWAYDELVSRIVEAAFDESGVRHQASGVSESDMRADAVDSPAAGHGSRSHGHIAVSEAGRLTPDALVDSDAGSRTPDAETAIEDSADARLGDVTRKHVDAIYTLLESTRVFRAEEIAVGVEVIESYLENPGQDYDVVGAFSRDGRLLGYACFGATPCTVGTYDLYWIAVSPDAQGRGIGKLIMQEVERRLARANARLVLI
ncbi:MAG TPA: GNAT family N-acetyltransferase, partial [Terriglobales bacterium]|nr:GNAT family N-acetyltransferase [Terriglobales bacterium]